MDMHGIKLKINKWINKHVKYLWSALQFEHMLALQPFCRQWEKEAMTLHHGESFCSFHAPTLSFIFSQEQWDILLTLVYATTFSQLKNLDLSEDLNEKIN